MVRGIHVCLLLSRGYSTKHVVEGLEPRTLYRFRLKVTSPSGEYEYSPVISVATTSEYTHAPHSLLTDRKPTSNREKKSLCSSRPHWKQREALWWLGWLPGPPYSLPWGRPAMLFKTGRVDLVPGLSCSWALGTGWKLNFLRSGLAGKDGASLLPHVSTVCFCARMCLVWSQISGSGYWDWRKSQSMLPQPQRWAGRLARFPVTTLALSWFSVISWDWYYKTFKNMFEDEKFRMYSHPSIESAGENLFQRRVVQKKNLFPCNSSFQLYLMWLLPCLHMFCGLPLCPHEWRWFRSWTTLLCLWFQGWQEGSHSEWADMEQSSLKLRGRVFTCGPEWCFVSHETG